MYRLYITSNRQTSCSEVLDLEHLPVAQTVNTFPSFYKTQIFNAFTRSGQSRIINYIHPRHSLSLLLKLTSSSGVFPQHITLPQVVKKLPNIYVYGNRMLATTLTKACHMSLIWPRSLSPHTPNRFLYEPL